MNHFNCFGNLMPPKEYARRPYLMAHDSFRIAGNLYFVGNLWCSSHLIDTGDGLILLDTPVAGALPNLLVNLEKLGFKAADIKYIVVSHAHTDHFGAVRALAAISGAKTFLGKVDAKDMRENPERMRAMNEDLGAYNECFQPDVELEDGDVIELGNTKIRCVLTPGHTIGVMSHFWQVHDGQNTWDAGIYGGAGFVSLSKAALERNGLPLSMQQTFLDSIDKVWSEHVDITLGNHPFHNDTFQKAAQIGRVNGENPFIDSGEWQRFLKYLKERFQQFLTLTPDQINEMYSVSQWNIYEQMIHDAEQMCVDA